MCRRRMSLICFNVDISVKQMHRRMCHDCLIYCRELFIEYTYFHPSYIVDSTLPHKETFGNCSSCSIVCHIIATAAREHVCCSGNGGMRTSTAKTPALRGNRNVRQFRREYLPSSNVTRHWKLIPI